MGFEIRKVPEGWKHPKTENGYYKPLYDRTHLEALEIYLAEVKDFIARYKVNDPDLTKYHDPASIENWIGLAPDPEYYCPHWTDGEWTHYQIYENVSEGTPVSPVFASLVELIDWLVSEEAAGFFAEIGYAFSIDKPSVIVLTNYDTLTLINESEKA